MTGQWVPGTLAEERLDSPDPDASDPGSAIRRRVRRALPSGPMRPTQRHRLRGTTLVVNLPGSSGGARDGVEYLSPIVPHLIDQLRGGDH